MGILNTTHTCQSQDPRFCKRYGGTWRGTMFALAVRLQFQEVHPYRPHAPTRIPTLPKSQSLPTPYVLAGTWCQRRASSSWTLAACPAFTWLVAKLTVGSGVVADSVLVGLFCEPSLGTGLRLLEFLGGKASTLCGSLLESSRFPSWAKSGKVQARSSIQADVLRLGQSLKYETCTYIYICEKQKLF